LHRSFAIAALAAVRSLIVIVLYPFIKVLLEKFQVIVQFFPEGNGIELFLHSTMQTFADAIALRMADLGFTVLDPFQVQV